MPLNIADTKTQLRLACIWGVGCVSLQTPIHTPSQHAGHGDAASYRSMSEAAPSPSTLPHMPSLEGMHRMGVPGGSGPANTWNITHAAIPTCAQLDCCACVRSRSLLDEPPGLWRAGMATQGGDTALGTPGIR
jgi:hypothetical protein